AVVDDGDTGGCDALAEQACERTRLLAVEVAFEPVADRLVQQDAGPARSEDDGHLAGRRRDGVEDDQRLAQRLVDRSLPVSALEIFFVAAAAAAAEETGFLATVLFHHDRHADAHERADVAIGLAAGTEDLDVLPFAGQRARHLLHARVLAARIG